MWRAIFLAVGVFLILLGVECLGVEKIVLKVREDPPPPSTPWEETPKLGPNKIISPKSWTPYSLLSTGAVVCLYSFTIPRRAKGE